MARMSFSALATTTLVAIAWAAPIKSIDEAAIAQVPPANANQSGLTVTGQGQGSGVADTAEVQLAFINYSEAALFERFTLGQIGVTGTGDASSAEGFSSFLAELEPITQASLQPIVDRLVAAGIPASAIEANLDASSSSGSPPFPEIDSAQIFVNLNRPSPAQIEAILTATQSALQGNDKLFLESSFVSFTSANCGAIEQQAYRAAIADARERANRIAAAAGVTITGTPSIAVNDPGGFSADLDSCNSELVDLGGEAAGATSATVELQRSLTVTYPIR